MTSRSARCSISAPRGLPAAALLASLFLGCSDSTGPGVAPGNIIILDGNEQSGLPTQLLRDSLRIRVESGTGPSPVRVPGATVTWTVLSGSASVTPRSAATDTHGELAAAIRLGTTTGPVAIRVTSGEVSAVFQIMSGNPCGFAEPLNVGESKTGELWRIDCLLFDNTGIDFFRVPISQTSSVLITMTSHAFDPYLFLLDSVGFFAGFSIGQLNDTTTVMRVILAPGNWLVGANSLVQATGEYRVKVAVQPIEMAPCEQTWITRGVDIHQTTSALLCDTPSGLSSNDRFLLVGLAGEGFNIGVSGQSFAASLALNNQQSDVMQAGASSAVPGQPVSFGYTPAQSAVFYLVVSGANGGTLGYDLSFH